MSKLRVAFYRAEKGSFDDKVIDRGTGSLGYSHCEVVVDSTTMIGAHYNAKGVKKFKYNDIYASGLWDVLEFDLLKKEAIKLAENFVKDRVGYDTLGAVLEYMHLGSVYKDTDKVWCSELCAKCINFSISIYDIKDIAKVDNSCMPNELYSYMLNNGATSIKTLASTSKYDKPVLDRFGRVEAY